MRVSTTGARRRVLTNTLFIQNVSGALSTYIYAYNPLSLWRVMWDVLRGFEYVNVLEVFL